LFFFGGFDVVRLSDLFGDKLPNDYYDLLFPPKFFPVALFLPEGLGDLQKLVLMPLLVYEYIVSFIFN